MTKEAAEIKLTEIFKSIFPGAKQINEEMTAENTREWDSLKHIMLITRVETAFGIKFDLDEMLEMKTYRQILDTILKKS